MSENVHNVLISERKYMELGGVTDVISFDENSVLLSTACGKMEIEGSGLHISALNVSNGQIKIEGTINGLFYYNETEKSEKRGLFGRIISSR